MIYNGTVLSIRKRTVHSRDKWMDLFMKFVRDRSPPKFIKNASGCNKKLTYAFFVGC